MLAFTFLTITSFPATNVYGTNFGATFTDMIVLILLIERIHMSAMQSLIALNGGVDQKRLMLLSCRICP